MFCNQIGNVKQLDVAKSQSLKGHAYDGDLMFHSLLYV